MVLVLTPRYVRRPRFVFEYAFSFFLSFFFFFFKKAFCFASVYFCRILRFFLELVLSFKCVNFFL